MGDVVAGSGAPGKGRKRKRVCWPEAELLEEVSAICRHLHVVLN